jgi:RNA polymerase sigma-70 factor (ECF subfamily)
MFSVLASFDAMADPAPRPRKGAGMSADRRSRAGRDVWAERLAAIASRQDRTAFAELFNHFAPRVKAFMRRNGATDQQAEEIAQETMLALWRKAHLFDPAAAGAATWIFTIARNLRIDAIRRETRGGAIRVDEVEAEYEVDDSPGADVQLAAAQSEARVREALTSLSSEQLQVIEMSFFEEKAHSEIAEALGIPLGTVKSRIRLAMKRLRAVLETER